MVWFVSRCVIHYSSSIAHYGYGTLLVSERRTKFHWIVFEQNLGKRIRLGTLPQQWYVRQDGHTTQNLRTPQSPDEYSVRSESVLDSTEEQQCPDILQSTVLSLYLRALLLPQLRSIVQITRLREPKCVLDKIPQPSNPYQLGRDGKKNSCAELTGIEWLKAKSENAVGFIGRQSTYNDFSSTALFHPFKRSRNHLVLECLASVFDVLVIQIAGLCFLSQVDEQWKGHGSVAHRLIAALPSIRDI